MADRLLLKDVLPGSLPELEIMDIGAMIEGKDRYQTLVAQGLARVTGFEPNADNLKALEARDGPYRYLPYFLGDGRRATFHMTNYPGCASLLEPNGDVINLFSTIGAEPGSGNFAVVGTTEVDTHRLDDIDGVTPPDYLKIDVQGAELMVLENATETLSGVVVLETEVEFVPIYRGQPLLGDIQTFLAGRGFMLHKLIDIAGRALRPIVGPNPYKAMSQALWADAVFVRDYADLAAYSDDQLLKASLVLNDVYLSYDVVVRLLSEYDNRSATALAAEYTKAVAAEDHLERLYMNLKEHP